jgi:hypothetical protein
MQICCKEPGEETVPESHHHAPSGNQSENLFIYEANLSICYDHDPIFMILIMVYSDLWRRRRRQLGEEDGAILPAD